MTILVINLSDADLDYWVAKVRGLTPVIKIAQRSTDRICVVGSARYAPSTCHTTGYIIIEELKISICYGDVDHSGPMAFAKFELRDSDLVLGDPVPIGAGWWEGDTGLIAAMRALVASVYGAEVPYEAATC